MERNSNGNASGTPTPNRFYGPKRRENIVVTPPSINGSRRERRTNSLASNPAGYGQSRNHYYGPGDVLPVPGGVECWVSDIIWFSLLSKIKITQEELSDDRVEDDLDTASRSSFGRLFSILEKQKDHIEQILKNQDEMMVQYLISPNTIVCA